jgi:hypothetical protein
VFVFFSSNKAFLLVVLKISMASYLRTVAGSSSSSANSESPTNELGKRLAKWALIIGVPTAVCVAAYLVYRQQQEQAKKSTARRPPLPTPLTSITSTTTLPTGKASGDTKSAGDTRVNVSTEYNELSMMTMMMKHCSPVNAPC